MPWTYWNLHWVLLSDRNYSFTLTKWKLIYQCPLQTFWFVQFEIYDYLENVKNSAVSSRFNYLLTKSFMEKSSFYAVINDINMMLKKCFPPFALSEQIQYINLLLFNYWLSNLWNCKTCSHWVENILQQWQTWKEI